MKNKLLVSLITAFLFTAVVVVIMTNTKEVTAGIEYVAVDFAECMYPAYEIEMPESHVVVALPPVDDSEPIYRIDITDEEIALMERVVMSEASIEPFEGKLAVAETIVNRVLSDSYPDSVSEICVAGQYSTKDNGQPNADCKAAVESVLFWQHFDDNITMFRTEHYHTFGEPAFQIGRHYFSKE